MSNPTEVRLPNLDVFDTPEIDWEIDPSAADFAHLDEELLAVLEEGAAEAKQEQEEAEKAENEALKHAREDADALATEDSFFAYKQKLGRALLTAAQEAELAKSIEVGLLARERAETTKPEENAQLLRGLSMLAKDGDRAKNVLIESNLRLVVSMAKRRLNLGLDFMDLIQEGNAGLVRAVERFDYTKGYRFSTFATMSIRGHIDRALTETDVIRKPVGVMRTVYKLRRTEAELAGRPGGSRVDIHELADTMGLTVEQVVELRILSQNIISTDAPLISDDTSPLGEFIADETSVDPVEQLHAEERAAQLDALLQHLPHRQRKVVELSHGLLGNAQTPVNDIAAALGVSENAVRQDLIKAMQRMRYHAGVQLRPERLKTR